MIGRYFTSTRWATYILFSSLQIWYWENPWQQAFIDSSLSCCLLKMPGKGNFYCIFPQNVHYCHISGSNKDRDAQLTANYVESLYLYSTSIDIIGTHYFCLYLRKIYIFSLALWTSLVGNFRGSVGHLNINRILYNFSCQFFSVNGTKLF